MTSEEHIDTLTEQECQQQCVEVGDQANMRSAKMGKTKMGRLIADMSVPAILSMLVQSLYNVVDSIFVSNISVTNAIYTGTTLGDDSFLAVSIVYPLMLLVNAIAIGIAIGTNAYISRKLGEGNREKASQAARTAIVMAIVCWVVVAIVGIFVSRPFVEYFVNANNATDMAYVTEQATMYIMVYMLCVIGFYIEMIGNRILQATGNMKVPMTCQLLGAVTNIVLDAVFILGFGWGVTGAIVATVIGQWVAGAFVLIVLFTRKQDVDLSFKAFRPQKEYIVNILKVGLPAFAINATASIVTILLNNLLKDGNGVWILAAYLKVQSFIFMPMFGLMQGCMPILGYNYGANNKQRFNKAIKIASIVLICILTFGLILFQTMPQVIMRILTDNTVLLQEGAVAFRAISLSFYFAGICILLINVLQATNNAILSLAISLTRQLVFLLPLAYLFYNWKGLNAVWYAYATAEALSAIIFLPFAVRLVKKQFARKQRQYELGILKKNDSVA